MSCVFLSIFSEQSLAYTDYAMIVIMTNVLCLCIPAIPSGSIFVVLIIANMVNVKSPNIALLYTVEWLLDR